MIEEQDAKGLATLPGIGPATAERVIAKLRRRVPKFALLVARDSAAGGRSRARPACPKPSKCSASWATARATPAGCSTAHSTRKPKYKDVDSLLHAVYEKDARRLRSASE